MTPPDRDPCDRCAGAGVVDLAEDGRLPSSLECWWCDGTGLEPVLEEGRLTEAVEGEMTFNDIRSAVQEAVAAWLSGQNTDTSGDAGCSAWVQDLSPEWAVFENSSSVADGPGLFKIGYSIDANGKVTLGDKAEKVAEQTSYVPTKESRDQVEGRVLESKGTDDAGGRIFRVRLINYGESKNGRRYPEPVMKAAARLYEGAKAFDHHRTDEEMRTSTIEGLVGSWRNVAPGDGGLDGDLHLFPGAAHTAEALDASLAAQGQGLTPLVGVSHDVLARYRQVVDGGRRFQEAVEIVSVNSTDVVADPAAGGRATRMVAGGTGDIEPEPEETPVTIEELLALIDGATPEQRAKALEGLGIKAEDLKPAGEVEPTAQGEPAGEPVKEPALAGATESYTKGSAIGRTVVRAVLEDANLDVRLTESIVEALGDKFTEADVARQAKAIQRVTEGLEAAGLKPTVPAGQVTADERDKKVQALDAMLAGDYATGYRSFKEAYVDFTGDRPAFLDTEDFNRKILRESAGLVPFDSAVRGTESLTSASWSQVLGDSITRRMIAEWGQPSLQAWRQIVSSIVPVNDFRTQRLQRIGGYGTLPIVNQGAPYQPLTSPGQDAEVTYAIQKRGGTEDLTLENIANDDLRVLQNIPRSLGLAAAQTLYRFVFDFFPTNPNLADGTALFAAGHGNTDANALSGGNVSVGRKKMLKQTHFGDSTNVLSIVPKLLIVCSDLEELGFQLTKSAVALPASAPVGGAADQPNLHNSLELLRIDYWSSTTAWFLTADPNMGPTFELGFYQGRQDPELFQQNDPTTGSVFTSDKLTYKIRHIYSGNVLDHRGFYRGNS